MQRAGSRSWSIRWDFPEELEFCAYIGQQEGYDATDGAQPSMPAEAEWRTWWQYLPTHTFGVAMEQVRREMPGASPYEQLGAAAEAGRLASGYNPPEFGLLADRPALRDQCVHHWPAFQRAWSIVGGTKMAFADSLHLQIGRLHLNRLVREACRTAGRRTPAPFSLGVDIVIWPQSYLRAISDAHLVIGTAYLDGGHLDRMRQLLLGHLVRLV